MGGAALKVRATRRMGATTSVGVTRRVTMGTRTPAMTALTTTTTVRVLVGMPRTTRRKRRFDGAVRCVHPVLMIAVDACF